MAKSKIHAAEKDRKILAFQVPVTITAAEGEGDAKAPPKFDVTAYSGGALDVGGWDRPVVIDLAGLQFSRNVIANLDHNSRQRVGHVTEKTKADGAVKLAGVFSASTTYRDEVVNSAADGFEWEASVEVSPTKIIEVDAGKKVTVNGQEFSGPIYVARKGTLSGFAFVSHGADPTTEVKIAASAASTKEKEMDEKFKAWIEAMLPGTDIETLSDDAIANLEANYKGQNGKQIKAAVPGNVFEEQKAEAKRRADINAYAQNYLVIRSAVEREASDEIDAVQKMCAHAIDSKMTLEEFRLAVLESSLPTSTTVFAPRERQRGISNEVIEAALCMAGNMSDDKLVKAFGDKNCQLAKDRFHGGIGLKQMYRLAAKANGYHYDGDDVTLDMQRAAFQKPSSRIQASGGFSTYDLSSALANTANKFLLEGWGSGEMTWQKITDVISVRDFKTNTFFKLSGNLKYKKIAPGGQIEHGQVSTDSYTVAAETYGRMFGIDRTAIINDDIGVITRIPRELGYGANEAFNEVFWTEFLDYSAFFTSGNANQSTGVVSAGAALATLAAAEAVFFVQTKPNGTPLGQLPNVWLLPPATYRIGANAIASSTVTGGSTTVPAVNTMAGLYDVVMSAYIANAAYSGSSAVKNYLLANRPGFSTMLTAFLNGRQAPIVETAEAMFNELGVQMRAIHDFGTNKMEYRAGVQGSGA